MKKLFLLAAAALAFATPAAAKDLPECSAVSRTLMEVANADYVFGSQNLATYDPSTGKRWCVSAIKLNTSLVDIRKVVYSLEWIDEANDQYWLQIKTNQSYFCPWFRRVRADNLQEWFRQCDSPDLIPAEPTSFDLKIGTVVRFTKSTAACRNLDDAHDAVQIIRTRGNIGQFLQSHAVDASTPESFRATSQHWCTALDHQSRWRVVDKAPIKIPFEIASGEAWHCFISEDSFDVGPPHPTQTADDQAKAERSACFWVLLNPSLYRIARQ